MIIADQHISTNKCLIYNAGSTIMSSDVIYEIADLLHEDLKPYLILKLSPGTVEISQSELLRLQNALEDSGCSMLFSDYREKKDGQIFEQECIDYQLGSVRDDFDFGHIVIIKAADFVMTMVKGMVKAGHKYASWYKMRLMLSLNSLPFHLNEFLYTYEAKEESAGSQFDYVNPRNRNVQIEYEEVFTTFLRELGAWTDHRLMKSATALDDKAEVMASVVIPVYNRVNTISDAVRSALSQECNFPFNVIVVDNHSTDGTTEALQEIAVKDSRLIHIIPDETTLKIGGCWNKAVNSEHCGNYIVQLDSDDMYSGSDTLQRMVDAFSAQDCMAVVGSYRLTDFNLNELPPGVIDHKEWTDENGMNNALRINGLGAPRGFRRDLLRQHPLPNTSYGEDYAAMLRICREYRIGRIYDSLYDCRRWSGNSDAALSREKINRNNLYKDKIRTIEILARKK